MEGKKPVAILITALVLIFGALGVFSLHLYNLGNPKTLTNATHTLTTEEKKQLQQSLQANASNNSSTTAKLTTAEKKALMLALQAQVKITATTTALTTAQKKAIFDSLQTK